MEKILKLLEQHVQWITMALGLGFVGYVVYFYVFTNPTLVKIGGADLTPGQADPVIVEKARNLKKKMDGKYSDQIKPTVANRVGELKDRIAEVSKGGDVAFAAGAVHGDVQITSSSPTKIIDQVAKLPVLPAALPDVSISRWTVVMMDGAPKPTRKDVCYYSGYFKIPVAAMQAAIGNAMAANPNIPPQLLKPQFAKVELYREEMDSSGAWSAPKLVAPVSVPPLPPYPTKETLAAAPQNKAKMQDILEFQANLEKNQPGVITPTFLPTAADAEKWTAPTAEAPAPAAAPAGGAAPAPAANGAAPAPVVGNAPAAPAGLTPVMNDYKILVHDTTLEEGKVYRYAVRYWLFNTLFNRPQLAAATVAGQYDIAGPDPLDPKTPEVWTDKVIPASTSFIFVQKIAVYKNNANFTQFIWKDGHWKEFPVKDVFPGDLVGQPSKVRYTLVDIRKDMRPPGLPYVILMADQGALSTQDEMGAAADPNFARLKAAVNGNAQANVH